MVCIMFEIIALALSSIKYLAWCLLFFLKLLGLKDFQAVDLDYFFMSVIVQIQLDII